MSRVRLRSKLEAAEAVGGEPFAMAAARGRITAQLMKQALTSTTCSKPPNIIRLPSNGMGGLAGFVGSMRGSSIIFFMPASRVAL